MSASLAPSVAARELTEPFCDVRDVGYRCRDGHEASTGPESLHAADDGFEDGAAIRTDGVDLVDAGNLAEYQLRARRERASELTRTGVAARASCRGRATSVSSHPTFPAS